MISKAAHFPVIADVIWPTEGMFRYVILICLGSFLVALTAQLAIPLSPVPITGQTFGVLLVGILLGKTRGALSLLAYLCEGALGLPVFAGGTAGLVKLAGPTGGYLFGMVAGAYIIGFLAERGWDRSRGTAALAMLAGNLGIYFFGIPWLAMFVGWKTAFHAGFIPFLFGDLIKLLLAIVLFPSLWQFVRAKNRKA